MSLEGKEDVDIHGCDEGRSRRRNCMNKIKIMGCRGGGPKLEFGWNLRNRRNRRTWKVEFRERS